MSSMRIMQYDLRQTISWRCTNGTCNRMLLIVFGSIMASGELKQANQIMHRFPTADRCGHELTVLLNSILPVPGVQGEGDLEQVMNRVPRERP